MRTETFTTRATFTVDVLGQTWDVTADCTIRLTTSYNHSEHFGTPVSEPCDDVEVFLDDYTAMDSEGNTPEDPLTQRLVCSAVEEYTAEHPWAIAEKAM